MDTKDLFNFQKVHRLPPGPGKLLLSEPFLEDPNFRRAVVLLAEHSDNGSLGFVLNKPLAGNITDLLSIGTSQLVPVYLGGPVAHDTLHFIHTDEENIAEATPIADGLYWGGNFAHVQDKLEQNDLALEKYRFFVGYSGWSDKQLEEELVVQTWIVAPLDRDVLFKASSGPRLWKTVLQRLGGHYRLLASQPTSSRLN